MAIRRGFTSFPGYDVLAQIEGSSVIDLPPPAISLGPGQIVACLVGEFEDGPYTPTRVYSDADIAKTYGAFGHVKNGVPYLYPVATKSAEVQYEWGGNGFIALKNKKLKGLVISRVDTSSGNVQLSRLAFLAGGSGPFDLESGQDLDISVDGGADVTGTFTGVRATKAGAAGTFPTLFVGGETLELEVDGVPKLVTFTSAAQTAAQVIAEINSQTASDIAVLNVTEVDLRSVVKGTSGTIEVVGGTGRATIGQSIGTATGTGNVGNIDAVTQAEAISILDALTGVGAGSGPDGELWIWNTATPGTGTIEVSGGTATGLGFTAMDEVVASTLDAISVPAGTVVKDSTTNTLWVTTKTADLSGGSAVNFGVRPALDDDTAPTAAAGDVDTVVDVLDAPILVANSADINRLTAAQMDARYITAIEATIDSNGVSRDINVIWAARSTANIAVYLKANAIAATANGLRARKFVFSPPIGTEIADALDDTGVGRGAVNHERCANYCYPGMTTVIPEILSVGSGGGTGFTDDGVIQATSDGFYVSVRSNIPPEENAGQDLNETNHGPMNVLNIEDQFNPAEGGTGLTLQNYITFKANGVCAPILDRASGMMFQSDVTAVDPTVSPAQASAKRRWMGDYLIDLLHDVSSRFVKKLNTPSRRRALRAAYAAPLEILKSSNQPESSRISDYSIKDATTDELRALGFEITNIQVQLYASMDSIVVQITAGETVKIEQVG